MLVYAREQLEVLYTIVGHPDLVQKDYSILSAVGFLYLALLGAMWVGGKSQGSRRRQDDQFFLLAMKSRAFYEDALACLKSADSKGQLPSTGLGDGSRYLSRAALVRPLADVVHDITAKRVAVLQAETPGTSRVQSVPGMGGLLLTFNPSLGPTWQQKRLLVFLRALTILYLCTLLHGSTSANITHAVSAGCRQGRCTREAAGRPSLPLVPLAYTEGQRRTRPIE